MTKQNKVSSSYAYIHYSTSNGVGVHKIVSTTFGKDAEEWATFKEHCISVASKCESQDKVQVWEFKEIPNWLGKIIKGY